MERLNIVLHSFDCFRIPVCSFLFILVILSSDSTCYSQDPPDAADESIVIGSDIDVITASFDELILDGFQSSSANSVSKTGESPAAEKSDDASKANGSSKTKLLNPLRGADSKTAREPGPAKIINANPSSSATSSASSAAKTSSSEKAARKAAEAQQEAPDLPVEASVGSSEEKAIFTDEPKKPSLSISKKVGASATESTKDIILSPDQMLRQQRVKSCLAYYLFRPESTSKRSPWGAMHSMLPFGVDADLIAGNKRVNAIGWLCYNGRCRTQQLFRPVPKGFTANIGPGFQGHEGQFLAMLAQSHVSADYPIRIGNQQFSISDLVRYEMAGCVEKSELTFKLIGLSHYLNTDQQWTSKNGHRWSIYKLIDEELNQPVVGSACGGTHRLMGLTYSVRKRHREGKPIDGSFLRAAIFIDEFIDYAWSLQNSDGSFSTNWFESRGNENDIDRKVQTTGHVVEWLVFALNPKELESENVTRSVDFLLANLLDNRGHDWSIGPRSHAIRALALYDQKLFGGKPGQRREVLAEINQNLFVR
jgi:hypothetical protein